MPQVGDAISLRVERTPVDGPPAATEILVPILEPVSAPRRINLRGLGGNYLDADHRLLDTRGTPPGGLERHFNVVVHASSEPAKRYSRRRPFPYHGSVNSANHGDCERVILPQMIAGHIRLGVGLGGTGSGFGIGAGPGSVRCAVRRPTSTGVPRNDICLVPDPAPSEPRDSIVNTSSGRYSPRTAAYAHRTGPSWVRR